MVLKGDLPIELTWKHNNQIYQQTSGVNIIKTSTRISTLNIESVNAHHRGTYQCIAMNLAGRSEHSADLYVNGIC